MLEIVNVLMRFFMWVLATYRWKKKQENFMLLLSIALWIDFLAALTQRPILEKLGETPEITALAPLLSLFAIAEGILLIATSLYVLNRFKTLREQFAVVLSVIVGSTYVLLAVLLSQPPGVLFAFPIPFTGFSLMLLGYALLRKEVSFKNVATLFPLGAFLLGLINLTYPITIKTHLAFYLYGAGAVFRGMMFIGMIKYALFHVKPPRVPTLDIPPGAFYLESAEHLEALLQKMQSAGNGILITREPPRDTMPTFPVFWITRVTQPPINENIMTVSPTDIGILVDLVKRHLEKGHSLVVIDCFEYLVLENGFENAFKFLLSLKDYATEFGATLIVATDPSLHSKKQWVILTRELEKLEL